MDDDVYTSGLLKRHTNRPANLEHVSLADWTAWYDSRGKRFQKKSFKIDVDGLPFETYDDDNNDDEAEHTNQLPKCKKRVKARIIRSVFFNKETDPEKHYIIIIIIIIVLITENSLCFSHLGEMKRLTCSAVSSLTLKDISFLKML